MNMQLSKTPIGLDGIPAAETVVTAETDRRTSVVFRLDLSELRRRHLVRAAGRGFAVFGLLGAAGGWMLGGFGPEAVVTLLGGGALAGGLAGLEQRSYQEVRDRLALLPEQFLDRLTRRAAIEPLALEAHDEEGMHERDAGEGEALG